MATRVHDPSGSLGPSGGATGAIDFLLFLRQIIGRVATRPALYVLARVLFTLAHLARSEMDGARPTIPDAASVSVEELAR